LYAKKAEFTFKKIGLILYIFYIYKKLKKVKLGADRLRTFFVTHYYIGK
jgi:hypothetical protein